MKPISAAVLAAALTITGGLAVAIPGVGAAQSARGQISDQPIMVGADGGERTPTGFALRGRAEVTQGSNRLRADAITGTSATSGAINSVTAQGHVYYVTPNETIRGDRAVYTVSNATIVVTGDVILTQGKNVLTGGRLTYNIDSGQATMDSAGSGRIQGVFYPSGSGN